MRKYDDEFKQNAVKKILDGQSVASVSRELGVAESLLHKWKKVQDFQCLECRKRILELEKAAAGSGNGARNFKKGGAYLRQRKLEDTSSLKVRKRRFPIKFLCRVMKVNAFLLLPLRERQTYRQSPGKRLAASQRMFLSSIAAVMVHGGLPAS